MLSSFAESESIVSETDPTPGEMYQESTSSEFGEFLEQDTNPHIANLYTKNDS